MSTIAKLNGTDFDRMVQRGAFVDLNPMKIELLYGELRFMNPPDFVPGFLACPLEGVHQKGH